MTALSLSGRDVWIDFSTVPAAGWDAFYASAKAQGVVGAIRYAGAGRESKQIHSAERQAANRHGIRLLIVDQLGTGDAWDAADDQAAGAARGRAVLADLRREGFGSIGIAAAADAHASGKMITDAVAYARGFAAAVGKPRAGFYGFMEVLRAVRAAGAVTWHWLTGPMPSAEDARWLAFWQDSRGTITIRGVQCDRNWRLDGPLPGDEEDEMAADFTYTNPAIDSRFDSSDGTTRPRDMHWFQVHGYDVLVETQRRVSKILDLLTSQSGVRAADIADALAPQLSTAMLGPLQAAIDRVAQSGSPVTGEAVIAELAKDIAAGRDGVRPETT